MGRLERENIVRYHVNEINNQDVSKDNLFEIEDDGLSIVDRIAMHLAEIIRVYSKAYDMNIPEGAILFAVNSGVPRLVYLLKQGAKLNYNFIENELFIRNQQVIYTLKLYRTYKYFRITESGNIKVSGYGIEPNSDIDCTDKEFNLNEKGVYHWSKSGIFFFIKYDDNGLPTHYCSNIYKSEWQDYKNEIVSPDSSPITMGEPGMFIWQVSFVDSKLHYQKEKIFFVDGREGFREKTTLSFQNPTQRCIITIPFVSEVALPSETIKRVFPDLYMSAEKSLSERNCIKSNKRLLKTKFSSNLKIKLC